MPINRIKYYLLVLAAVTSAGGSSCYHSEKNKTLIGIEHLPHFTLLTINNSRIIESTAVCNGRPCLFYYIDPDCPHCQNEAREVVRNLGALRSVNIYFVSESSHGAIDTFYHHFNLDKARNVFVALDSGYSFFNSFLPTSIPYTAVYNENGSLLRTFYGEANIDTIISLVAPKFTAQYELRYSN